MSLQWPAPLFVSGGQNASGSYVDFTTAQPVGLPVFESPIPSTTKEYIFRQPFMQFRANFTPTPLGTVHPSAGQTPDYSNYFLVKEDERRDIEGGIVRWIRTYAIKPDTHDEYETAPYNFIGFTGVWNIVNYQMVGTLTGTTPLTITVTGRPRFVRGVDSRVRHDYFITGASGAGLVTPDFASPDLIPSNLAQLYRADGGNTFFVDFINDVLGSPLIIPITGPSYTEYKTWTRNASQYGFQSSVTVTAWSSSLAYDIGDPVYDANTLYSCKLAVGPTATHPGSDATHWNTISVAWSSAGVYYLGDFATDSGVLYSCIEPVGPSATHPASDTAHWGTFRPGQLTAEDSRLSRWQGNIWVRQTRYVLAV